MAYNNKHRDNRSPQEAPEEWQQYADMLGNVPEQPVPPGFTERVERNIQAGIGVQAPQQSTGWKIVPALAVVSIMIAIGLNKFGVFNGAAEYRAAPVVQSAPQVEAVEDYVILPELSAIQVDTLIPDMLPPGAVDPVVPGSIEAARQEVVYEQYPGAAEPVVPGLPYVPRER